MALSRNIRAQREKLEKHQADKEDITITILQVVVLVFCFVAC
jgi:hypothetical protein